MLKIDVEYKPIYSKCRMESQKILFLGASFVLLFLETFLYKYILRWRIWTLGRNSPVIHIFYPNMGFAYCAWYSTIEAGLAGTGGIAHKRPRTILF